jgi:hypothetical protein
MLNAQILSRLLPDIRYQGPLLVIAEGHGGKLSLGVGMFFALIGIWLDFRWDGHRQPCLSNVALALALLPPDHPAGRMARLAEQVPAPTWCSRFVPSWVL